MKKEMKRMLKGLLCLIMTLALLAGASIGAAAEGTGISLQLSASVTGDGADEYNSMLGMSSITADAGAAESGSFVLDLKAVMMGRNLIHALLEIGQEKVAFALPDLDENVYGYSTEKLMELLEEVLGGEEGGAAQIPLPEITPEEVQEALMPYVGYLGQAIGEKVQTQEEAAIELKKLGREVTGPVAVYEPAAEDLAEIFTNLADMLEKDENVAALVEKIAGYLENTPGLDTILTLTGQNGQMSPAEAAAALREGFAQLPAAMKDAASSLTEEGMGDAVIRFTVGMDPSGSAPCKLSAYIGQEEAGEYYEFGFENDPEADGYQFCLYMENHEEEYDLMASGSNVPGEAAGTVSLRMSETPVAVISYNWNLMQHTLLGLPVGTVSVEGLGTAITFTSAVSEESGCDYILAVEGMDNVTGSTDITGVQLTLHADTADAPAGPAGTPVDISDYTPEQLTELFNAIGEKVGESLSAVFGE